MSDQELKFAVSGSDNGAKAVFNDVGASIATTAQRVDAAAKSVQNMAAKLDKAAASAAAMPKGAQSAEMSIGNLGKGIEAAALKIPGLDAGVGSLTTAFSALSNPLVAIPGLLAGAAAAAGSLAMGNADLIEHLGNLSITTGLTIQELYALREVALASGIELDSMAKAASKLETTIGKGSKELHGLGLTGSDTIEDMAKIADAFNAAATQADKNAIATAAFGKGWHDLAPLLAEGGEAIRKLRTDSELSELDIEKYKKLDEAADQLAKSWRGIKFEIGGLAAGPMVELLKITQQVVAAAPKIAQILGKTTPIGAAVSYNAYVLGKLFPSTPAAPTGTTAATPKTPVGISAAEQESRDAEAKRLRDKQIRDDEAREKTRQAEIKFQRSLIYEMEMLGLDADKKELRRIQEKYALLREEHKKHKASIAAIDAAQTAETLNAQMQINFRGLAGQRDNDQLSAEMPSAQPAENPKTYQYNSKMKKRSVGEQSLGNAITNAPDEMQESWRKRASSPEEITSEYEEHLDDLATLSDSIANNIAESFSSVTGPALINVFSEPMDAIEALGEGAKSVLLEMADMIVSVTAKWALLYLMSSALKGGANEISEPGGLGQFIAKSLGGHADGTLSSPGGLRYLGENGPEPYQTPSGQRGIATYGLYHVPAGTRVDKASSNQSDRRVFNIHLSSSDPVQQIAQIRRIAHDEILAFDSASGMTREKW